MFKIMINHPIKQLFIQKKLKFLVTIWKSDSNFDFIERETVF